MFQAKNRAYTIKNDGLENVRYFWENNKLLLYFVEAQQQLL
jgi:hypothetical protein